MRCPPEACRRPFALLLVCAAACTSSRGPRASGAPPTAEFLVSTADSTFWISTGGGRVRVRGEPLTLARYDGHFYEVYSADDDFSYADALLLGERLYRRDLKSDDSAIVFVDTVVPRLAAAYARAHPDEEPLGPDDDGEADPSTSAAADVDILGVLGPYLSYEYGVDVKTTHRRPWHSTRRGVIDLRSRRAVTVTDLFGTAAGAAVAAQGRHMYDAERDSVLSTLRGLPGETDHAAAMFGGLHFDPTSFTLDEAEGQPSVTFAIPTRGSGGAQHVVELDPLPVQSTSWWDALTAAYPRQDAQGDDRWTRSEYEVVAHYDSTGETAQLAIADRGHHEWSVAMVSAPIQRIDWLDHPALSSSDRRALVRAFDEAAAYDENTRVASAAHATDRLLVSNLHHAPIQDRPRKPARDLRAHDAGARQQHGPRVRRRDSLDDGQVRSHRGIPPQPRQRRHGID